jgi:ribosomal-protein-alanine N-acetyltransferase
MLKISLMDQSDLEFAYEIEKEVNPTPWSKKNFFSSFEVGHNSIVCKHENNLIGFAIFSLVKEESHLLNIAVTKSWHRKGAGSLLMNTLIKQSKVLGAQKVFLEVRSKNFNAISFYKKYKFIQDALRINYYAGSNPDDAVMMSLDI